MSCRAETSVPYMELGKPDAGKPPVRFDEGREADGHWLCLSFRRFPPTLHIFISSSCETCCLAQLKHSVLKFLILLCPHLQALHHAMHSAPIPVTKLPSYCRHPLASKLYPDPDPHPLVL